MREAPAVQRQFGDLSTRHRTAQVSIGELDLSPGGGYFDRFRDGSDFQSGVKRQAIVDVKDYVLFFEGPEALLGHAQTVVTDGKALEPVVAARVGILTSRISGVRVGYRDLSSRDCSALLVRHGATRGTHIGLCEHQRPKAQCHHQRSYQRR